MNAPDFDACAPARLTSAGRDTLLRCIAEFLQYARWACDEIARLRTYNQQATEQLTTVQTRCSELLEEAREARRALLRELRPNKPHGFA